ncbi:hypothetical protein ACN20G_36940 (plasmid) [Streptomyces sp. BI20]|uniref:hypothetical protein n=1 Tax=Streptomyces sp. BI20 TaxID=3403460 RepID=UPI003C77B0BA
MSYAFLGDAATKALAELTPREQGAVELIRRLLEDDPTPDGVRGLPDADPASESYAIDITPEVTGGRGITVVYRHVPDLDACLVSWIIAGP